MRTHKGYSFSGAQANTLVEGPSKSRQAVILSVPTVSFYGVAFGDNATNNPFIIIPNTGTHAILTRELLGDLIEGDLRVTYGGAGSFTIATVNES